jgi:hypothetical protein
LVHEKANSFFYQEKLSGPIGLTSAARGDIVLFVREQNRVKLTVERREGDVTFENSATATKKWDKVEIIGGNHVYSPPVAERDRTAAACGVKPGSRGSGGVLWHTGRAAFR